MYLPYTTVSCLGRPGAGSGPRVEVLTVIGVPSGFWPVEDWNCCLTRSVTSFEYHNAVTMDSLLAPGVGSEDVANVWPVGTIIMSEPSGANAL